MAKIDLDLIQELRTKTGVGMMDCKKALQEADGNLATAIDLLRKKGALVAEKRSGNATSEGIIHSYIHAGSRIGVMVEINCETDFVARTPDMTQFAQDLCLHIAAVKPLYVSPQEVDTAFLEKERAFFREQLVASGKPEKMIESIIEGKLKKLYADVCLLQQPFVKNDQLTIEDLLKGLIAKMGESIKIKRFVRFEIGVN